MINSYTTRQDQILALLLNAADGLSIEEMAAGMEISRNAVKQHLLGLEKQQLVRKEALNNTRGRPGRKYRLTQRGVNRFPKQYAGFCNQLLTELAGEMDKATLEQWMWKLGVKQANSFLAQFALKNPDERLQALVLFMQQLGYHAETETLEGGQLVIKAVNCVYHDIALQHPEICHFDRALISTLLKRSVEQTACIANHDCACRFKPG